MGADAFSCCSQFCNAGTVVIKGESIVERVYGTVAANATPGRVFCKSGRSTYNICDGSTDMAKQIFILDHELRTSSTFGEYDIDNLADVVMVFNYQFKV